MELNDKQLKTISDVLDIFERNESVTTGVKRISGGFAHAEMFSYDEDYVDIELKWGVQSDCEDNVHSENYKLSMEVVDNEGLTAQERYLEIQSA